MTEERAAGAPAARLISQVISEFQSIDQHRRHVAGDDAALEQLLLGFEEEAVQGMADQLRSSLAGIGFGNFTPPSEAPGVRDRIQRGLGRFGVRGKHLPKHRQMPVAGNVVQGTVVSDEPPIANGDDTAADSEAPKDTS